MTYDRVGRHENSGYYPENTLWELDFISDTFLYSHYDESHTFLRGAKVGCTEHSMSYLVAIVISTKLGLNIIKV